MNNDVIFILILLYALSIIVTVGINVYFFLKSRKTALYYAFMRIQTVLFIWLLFKTMALLSNGAAQAWIFTGIQFLGVCFFGVVILDLAYLVFFEKKMSWIMRIVAYGISLGNYGVLLTNPIHGLFYKEFSPFHKVFGPWFYVHTLTSYTMLMVGYFYLICALKARYGDKMTAAGSYRRGYLSVVLLLLPLGVNILNVVGVIPPAIDLTPVAFNTVLAIFSAVSFHEIFMDIPLFARYALYDQLQDGIIILDKELRILECNKTFQMLMGEQYPQYLNKPLKSMMRDFRPMLEDYDAMLAVLDSFNSDSREDHTQMVALHQGGSRMDFRARLQKVFEKHADEIDYYILRLEDVTSYNRMAVELKVTQDSLQQIQRDLSAKWDVKQQLAAVRERNEFSRELHDILGHSLTVVRGLLESAAIAEKSDRALAMEKLTVSQKLIRDSYSDLSQSLKGGKNPNVSTEAMEEEIRQLGRQIEGLGTKVEVFFRTNRSEIRWHIYDSILRICQEGMTNALRHGEAKQITIGLSIKEELNLIIADDGKGCADLKRGNGLNGMDQRTTALSGSFACGSPEGEGFTIHVKIPVDLW